MNQKRSQKRANNKKESALNTMVNLCIYACCIQQPLKHHQRRQQLEVQSANTRFKTKSHCTLFLVILSSENELSVVTAVTGIFKKQQKGNAHT